MLIMIALSIRFPLSFLFLFLFPFVKCPAFFLSHTHTLTHLHRRICTVPYTFIIFRNWNAKLRIYWGVRSASRRSSSKWKWKWTCVNVWVSIEGEKERERKKKRTNQIKCCRNRFFSTTPKLKSTFSSEGACQLAWLGRQRLIEKNG